MESYRIDLFVIAIAAVLAPVLSGLPKRLRLPIVVAELLVGMLIGPHLFNWVSVDGLVGMLGELGLTFLLFMVGMEIDLVQIRGKPLTLAIGGWCLSLSVAMVGMYFVHKLGWIQAPPLLAAVALSTTALGVLTPILRDNGLLGSDFGKLLLSAAAIGELGPLVVISLLIIPTHNTWLHTLLILAFVVITVTIADTAIRARSSALLDLLSRTMTSTGQLPVRICIALQALLVVLAGEFGLNIVLGAFAAGMVVGLTSTGDAGALLRQKLDAIGYGFLIPIFFITAGMKFDMTVIWSSPLALIQVLCLMGMLILVRGAPLLLYDRVIAPGDKLPFALYSATGLPLIVVISEIGVSSGLMDASRAALLVAAGMASVVVFPAWAAKIRSESGSSA